MICSRVIPQYQLMRGAAIWNEKSPRTREATNQVSDYCFCGRGEGVVHSRLMSHFGKIVGASYYRVEYTGSKLRAHQRQNANISTS